MKKNNKILICLVTMMIGIAGIAQAYPCCGYSCHHYYHYGHHHSDAAWAGLAGVVAGTVLGSALAAPRTTTVYTAPAATTYVAPAPVTYVAPAPAYVAPAYVDPTYVAPVYVPPPVVVAPPPVVYGECYGYGYGYGYRCGGYRCRRPWRRPCYYGPRSCRPCWRGGCYRRGCRW